MFIEKKYWATCLLLVSMIAVPYPGYAKNACVSAGIASPNGIGEFKTRHDIFAFNHALLYFDIGTSSYRSVQEYLDRGVGVILALKLKAPADGKTSILAAIRAGTYDGAFAALATNIREDGRPITLRPLFESNGDWYPWQAYYAGNRVEDLVPAWKHIVTLFRKKQVPVRFDFNVNRSSARGKGNSDFKTLFPGDDVVDTVSVSSYNRCGSNASHLTWHSFSEEFRPAYTVITSFSQRPIAVAETSSTSQCGGDKAAWFTQLFEDVATSYPRLENITFYLNTREAGLASNDAPLHWELENDGQKKAFKDGLRLLRKKRGNCSVGLVPNHLTSFSEETPWFGDSVRFPWSTFMEGTGYVHERSITARNTVTGEDFGKAEATLRWKFKQSALWDVWGGTFGPYVMYGGVESVNKNRWWDNVQTLGGGFEYCSKKPSFVDWGNVCGVFGAEQNWYTAPVPDRIDDGDEKVFFRIRVNMGGEW